MARTLRPPGIWTDRHPTHPTTSETQPPRSAGATLHLRSGAHGHVACGPRELDLLTPPGNTSSVDACHRGGRCDAASPPPSHQVNAPDLTRGPGTRMCSAQTGGPPQLEDSASDSFRPRGKANLPVHNAPPTGPRHCATTWSRTTRAGAQTTAPGQLQLMRPSHDQANGGGTTPFACLYVSPWLASAPHSN